MVSPDQHRGVDSQRRQRLGVTTVETLVAFGLLSALTVAVALFVRHCNRVSERILSRVILQDCVANTTERIKSLPFDEVTVERCKAMPFDASVAEKFSDAAWLAEVTSSDLPVVAKKVTLSISIRDELGREQVPVSLTFWVPRDATLESSK